MNYLTDEELQLCSEIRASCACNKLRMGARGLTQLYEATMAQSGLKVTQLPVLVALASVGDVPITTLSNILRIDRTTLTRNLKVLEDRGLVTTYESEDDARVRMVSFTLEGSRALAGALDSWERAQGMVEARFGRERLQALYAELEALAEAVGA